MINNTNSTQSLGAFNALGSSNSTAVQSTFHHFKSQSQHVDKRRLVLAQSLAHPGISPAVLLERQTRSDLATR